MPNDTTVEFDASKYTPEVLADAAKQGWEPPDKFKGNGTWLPPDKFIERGQNHLGIVRSKLTTAEQRIATLERQNAEIVADAREFKKMAVTAAERDWKEKYDTLKAAYAQAVKDGEGDRAAEVQEAIDDHRDAKPKPADTKATATGATQEPPAWLNAWIDENTWYRDNEDARMQANLIGVRLQKTTGKQGVDLANAVKEEMEQRFPEMVGVDTRGSTVVTPGRRVNTNQSSKAKTYENLPEDAQKACDRYIKNGMVKDRAEYVANYSWDD